MRLSDSCRILLRALLLNGCSALGCEVVTAENYLKLSARHQRAYARPVDLRTASFAGSGDSLASPATTAKRIYARLHASLMNFIGSHGFCFSPGVLLPNRCSRAAYGLLNFTWL